MLDVNDQLTLTIFRDLTSSKYMDFDVFLETQLGREAPDQMGRGVTSPISSKGRILIPHPNWDIILVERGTWFGTVEFRLCARTNACLN